METENNIVLFCDRCSNDLFYIVDNNDLMCSKCNSPMINLRWDYTSEEEEYVEFTHEATGEKYEIK